MELRLQELRKAAGWRSAREFAEHIGMPVSTYTAYEQQKRHLYLDTAWMLCEELGCTLDELCGLDAASVERRRFTDGLTEEQVGILDQMAEQMRR
jgi:transcriptional regulator with XRE-family HTH domain